MRDLTRQARWLTAEHRGLPTGNNSTLTISDLGVSGSFLILASEYQVAALLVHLKAAGRLVEEIGPP